MAGQGTAITTGFTNSEDDAVDKDYTQASTAQALIDIPSERRYDGKMIFSEDAGERGIWVMNATKTGFEKIGGTWVDALTATDANAVQNTVTSNIEAQTGVTTFSGIHHNITDTARTSTGAANFFTLQKNASTVYELTKDGFIKSGSTFEHWVNGAKAYDIDASQDFRLRGSIFLPEGGGVSSGAFYITSNEYIKSTNSSTIGLYANGTLGLNIRPDLVIVGTDIGGNPSISPSGEYGWRWDTGTSLYRKGAGNIALSTSSIDAIEIDASQTTIIQGKGFIIPVGPDADRVVTNGSFRLSSTSNNAEIYKTTGGWINLEGWVDALVAPDLNTIQNAVTSDISAQTGVTTFDLLHSNITETGRASSGLANHLRFEKNGTDVFRVGIDGFTTITGTGGIASIGGNGSFAASATNSTNVSLSATTTSTIANSKVLVRTPAGGADPYIHFDILSTNSFAVGIDNNDSDTFKIRHNAGSSASPSLGTELFSITTTGYVTLAASGGRIGLYGATAVARATTGITAAAFVANTSGTSDDTATFGGYTIGQIAQALINIGALT